MFYVFIEEINWRLCHKPNTEGLSLSHNLSDGVSSSPKGDRSRLDTL